MKKIFLLLFILPLLSFNATVEPIDLVGKWVGTDKGIIGSVLFDAEGYATFETEGQVMGGKEFVVNGKKGKMTYQVNSAANPMEVDFTITKIDTGESKSLLGIVKFIDANTLVLAIAFDQGRPIDFNSTNSIQLKRVL